MKNNLSRRAFMERLGICTVGGAALSQIVSRPAAAQGPDLPEGSNTVTWNKPPALTNPNILIITVDQLRWPCWLDSTQMNMLDKMYLPNIFGLIRDNSYAFQQYYTAATMCTPSRATLLTGLYAPQTAVYETGDKTPSLDPAFPNWGQAMASLNSSYANNVWWFGKWHLSDSELGSSLPPPSTAQQPLLAYGFQTSNYPGVGGPSPNGWPNEGLNGGVNMVSGPDYGVTYANDAMIAQDFTGWLGKTPNGPWCATVSFVNPHDIGYAPAWFADTPPASSLPVYFQTDFPNNMQENPMPPGFATGPSQPMFPPASQPKLTLPSPWNWENLTQVTNKPYYQYTFQQTLNTELNPVSNWTTFLNEYYWLQNYVDQQVGRVLTALKNSPYAGNTIVIFTSDHGEYGGSHGLHDKGGAVYDESLHVPLYVQFPGQAGCTQMNQMCSSVDFFGLVCDLATSGGAVHTNSGSGNWQYQYPNLANRESIWNYLFTNSAEAHRLVNVAPGNVAIPYILHTVDETNPNEYCPAPGAPATDNRHMVCLRTKYNPSSPSPGGKLAVYSYWAPNNTCWDGVTKQEYEFYDYNPATTNNQKEMGNDYTSSPSPTYAPPNQSNPTTLATIQSYVAALGNWGPPPCGFNGTGLIASELDAPLTGNGTDGNPLTAAQAAAQQLYYKYFKTCSS